MKLKEKKYDSPKHRLIKILIMTVSLILTLIVVPIVSIKLYILLFGIILFSLGSISLIFKIPNSRVVHTNSKHYNTNDISYNIWELLIGIVIIIIWLKFK